MSCCCSQFGALSLTWLCFRRLAYFAENGDEKGRIPIDAIAAVHVVIDSLAPCECLALARRFGASLRRLLTTLCAATNGSRTLFDVVCDGRTYHLAAPTPEAAESWVKAIDAWIVFRQQAAHAADQGNSDTTTTDNTPGNDALVAPARWPLALARSLGRLLRVPGDALADAVAPVVTGPARLGSSIGEFFQHALPGRRSQPATNISQLDAICANLPEETFQLFVTILHSKRFDVSARLSAYCLPQLTRRSAH